MAHTPAPWKWEEGNSIITHEWNGRDCIVASVFAAQLAWHENRRSFADESAANARLIAASPSMLEALKAARTVLHRVLYDSLAELYPRHDERCAAIEEHVTVAKMDAAIKAAEGGE